MLHFSLKVIKYIQDFYTNVEGNNINENNFIC